MCVCSDPEIYGTTRLERVKDEYKVAVWTSGPNGSSRDYKYGRFRQVAHHSTLSGVQMNTRHCETYCKTKDLALENFYRYTI